MCKKVVVGLDRVRLNRLLFVIVFLTSLFVFDALCVSKAWANTATMIHNSTTLGSTKWGSSWGVTGGKYGAFTCNTCHGRNTGNIKRVKATITTPDGSNWDGRFSPDVTVNFQSTSGANSFGDDGRAPLTSSNMVCEACHSQTAVHRYDSSAITDFNHKNANQTDCMVCHPHNVGFTPLACDSCHGYPPTTNDNNGSTSTGLAFNPVTTGSNTAGAHAKHAVDLGYSCDNCHLGYIMPNNGDIDIHFSNFGSTSGTYTGQLGVSYNSAAGTGGLTCNAVYCHSNGQSADGLSAVPTYAAVTWGGTAACGSCHAVAGLTSGSHAAHLGATGVNGCGDCHADAANDASVYNSAIHVDGAINVTGTYTAAGTPGNGYGTCSTAACHDDGTNTLVATPTWGNANNDCSACHATIPATGSHVKHVTTQAISAAIGCGDCHGTAVQGTTAPAAPEHMDGNLDVYNSAALDLGYPVNVAKGGAPYDSCSTAYCHSNGKGTYQSVTWGATLTGCASCHGYPPAGGHPSNSDCQACHTNVNATNNGFVDVGLHIDGIVQAEGGDSCIDCHASLSTAHAAHTDETTILGAATLSGVGYAGLGNWYTATYVSGKPNFGCGLCHPYSNAAHMTGGPTVNLAWDDTNATGSLKANNGATAAYAGAGGACSQVYCHSDGKATATRVYGWQPSPNWSGGTLSGNCNDCHGNSPSSNAHQLHAVGIHYETLTAAGASGLMAASGISGSGAAHGDAATADIIGCQSCHNNTVAVEYNSGNSVCVTCHYSVPGTPATGAPATGNERAIINSAGATHVNGQADVAFASFAGFKSKAQVRNDITSVPELTGSWARYNTAGLDNTAYKQVNSFDQAKNAAPNYNSALMSCSTVDCHNGYPSDWDAQGDIDAGTYVSNCMACHKQMPQ